MSRPHRVYVVQGLALDRDRIVCVWLLAWFHDGEGARADALAQAAGDALIKWDRAGRKHPISSSIDRVVPQIAEMVKKGNISAVGYMVTAVTDDPTAACSCGEYALGSDPECPMHGGDPDAGARALRNAELRTASVYGTRV